MKKPVLRFVVMLVAVVAMTMGSTSLCSAAGGSAAITRLRTELDRIFADSRFAGAHWGVQIYSLDRSEVLYEKNPAKLLIPASNAKLITTSAALLRLGPDYCFRTLLLTDGSIEDGALKGDLVVAGFGDPSITVESPDDDPFDTFRAWAFILKSKGIEKITGDILGDSSAFENPMLGQGWAWDDLTEGYAAPVSALQFNENRLWLRINPRNKKSGFPKVELLPLPEYWIVDNKLTIKTESAKAKIGIDRSPSNDSIVASGTVPANGMILDNQIAVNDPVHFYLASLKHVLASEGIDVAACGIREAKGGDPQSMALLWTHTSAPLSEIIKPLLKDSLNLYAETLVRVLGMELNKQGSFEAGREVVEETLGRMAIDKDRYLYADGSGLSRLNLASAEMLVRILRSMYRHPCFSAFHEALAIAGRDGTLENRLKGTRAEDNLHGKTGSLSGVSSISGYVKTRGGEMLAFSIIANNFLLPKSETDAAQDGVLQKLADFKRQ
jgi:D-alanyl-D-alanine carboxypeptidase/D-alanyl-D-alanine-endopeptidase (penicillin-binding protein 4)